MTMEAYQEAQVQSTKFDYTHQQLTRSRPKIFSQYNTDHLINTSPVTIPPSVGGIYRQLKLQNEECNYVLWANNLESHMHS